MVSKIKSSLSYLNIFLAFAENSTAEEFQCLNNGSCLSNFSRCFQMDKNGSNDKNCEYKFCSDQDNQCQNGTCLIETKLNKKFCMCLPGYKGALCEYSICLNYCYNNGTCSLFKLDSDSVILNCTCASDRYSGDRCQFDKCIKNKNICPEPGFIGPDCKCLTNFEEKVAFRPINKSKSFLKFIIYSLAITFLVCLFVVGCFYSMHYAKVNRLPDLDRISRASFSTRNRFQKDFRFSKLEDEQIIIQNEQFINA